MTSSAPTSIPTEQYIKKTCEQCKRRRRPCNSQRPCTQCVEANQDCAYSVVHDHSRSVFSTHAARRLSSGSACETCRRRKTKCDGGSPCGFCASNNIECVNNSERRHLKNKQPSVEAMDRIEDRLRRIERLMTAFTPSPLTQSSSEGHKVRPHRHSVQGVNSAREKKEIQDRRGSPYSSRFGSLSPPPSSTPISIMRPSNSHSSSIAHSMLNLSISPSNSSTLLASSSSTPSSSGIWLESSPNGKNEYFRDHLPSPPVSSRSENEWKISTIPSVMDQLSKRTFATTTSDYASTQFPIYPLTPPPSQQNK